VRVLPCEDEKRLVRVSGSRGVPKVRAVNPLAWDCPVTVVGIYLIKGHNCVCACRVRVLFGEGLGYGVKICEFLIKSPPESEYI
jgi:hypothetical protein